MIPKIVSLVSNSSSEIETKICIFGKIFGERRKNCGCEREKKKKKKKETEAARETEKGLEGRGRFALSVGKEWRT